MEKTIKPKAPFAVIFDMDGVVIDNAVYHFLAWQALARRHGVQLTKKYFFERLSGRTGEDTMERVLRRKVSKTEMKNFLDQKERVYRKLYRPHLNALPGLVAFLKSLRVQGVPCALATSAPPENVRFVLGGLKIKKYFDTIVDAEGVKRGKPHPEMFLKAAKKLGMPPRRCIVFEDALLGIEAARRAKMKTMGVATVHSRTELREVGANLAVKDFRLLLPAKLLALF